MAPRSAPKAKEIEPEAENDDETMQAEVIDLDSAAPRRTGSNFAVGEEIVGALSGRRANLTVLSVHLQNYPGSPYSPSRFVDPAQKEEGESPDSFDNRMADRKAHYDGDDAEGFVPSPDDVVVLPPMSITKALESAAKMKGYKVPGRMRMTYTSIIRQGLMLRGPIPLLKPDGTPIRRKDLGYGKFHLDAQGQSGGGRRVYRRFPVIRAWQVKFELMVSNPDLDLRVLRDVFEDAGFLTGFGRFRKEVGGTNGLYEIVSIKRIK